MPRKIGKHLQLLRFPGHISNQLLDKMGKFNAILVCDGFQSIVILDFITVPLQVETPDFFQSNVVIIFRTAPVALHANGWLLLSFPIAAMFATPRFCPITGATQQHKVLGFSVFDIAADLVGNPMIDL